MRCGFWLVVISLLVALPNNHARADEPKKKPVQEGIPAPKQKIVEETILQFEPPRPGTIEMWRYYGVDGTGRFRPRVISTPSGAYYMQTLQPYPWVRSRSAWWLRNVVD